MQISLGKIIINACYVINSKKGSVVELVDAPHSKCGTFGFVGSSPTAPTSLMGTYKRLPLEIIRGKGCWVWDSKGQRFLDAVAGIASCSLGHSDQALRRKLSQQLRKIQHVSNLYQISEQEELAHWLTTHSCADKVFFCNSGAEANEAAIKLARKYGHNVKGISDPKILVAEKSFHGRTLATLSATGQFQYQRGFEPLVNGFHFFPYNDLAFFSNLVEDLEANGPSIAAVLIETLQGEGGVIPGQKSFFDGIQKLCKKHQILLIFDEVQTGMGRTGNWWGYEQLGIEPDAFTLAKGLGGGHAIGALLVKDSFNLFEAGDHASTFGGNPFACKAGLTVANEIMKRQLLKNVKDRALELKEGLKDLVNKFSTILEESRGIGLIQALVISRENNITAKEITNLAINNKLLVVPAGDKVVRIVPPLIINANEIKQIINRLSLAIDQIKS